MFELGRNIYKYCTYKIYMGIQIGSKNPSREVSLGRFGSWVFVIIFMVCMGFIAYYLTVTFLVDEENQISYINCNDGTVEKLTPGVYTYCGEYVGGDTTKDIKEYVERVHQSSINNQPIKS